MLLFHGYRYNPKQVLLLQRLATSVTEETHGTTLVHNVLLGVESMSLDCALERSPGDINRLDGTGLTPMHWAIWSKDHGSLRTMLARPECNIQVQTHMKSSLLHFAVMYDDSDDAEMTKALLNAGADVNACDAIGDTPIMLAFSKPRVIQLLLEHGADPTIASTNYGCSNSFARLASRFLSLFHDVPDNYIRQQAWADSIELLLSVGIDLDMPDEYGTTALHMSIESLNRPFTRLLIRYGARIDAVDNNDWGLLHYAAQYADLAFIRLLEDEKLKGISPDALNDDGESPMKIIIGRMLASEEERPPAVTVPTYEELLAFKELLGNIKSRNMNEGSATKGTSQEQHNPTSLVDIISLDGEGMLSDRSFESGMVLVGSNAWSNLDNSVNDDVVSELGSGADIFFDARSDVSL